MLTSLPRRVLDQVLDAAGLRCHIDLALSVDDVPRGLPAPDLVLMSVLRTGAWSVGEVAVIHGTDAGVESGRRSGASIVAGVLTGPHPARRLRSAGATHILDSFADLPGLLLPGDAAASVPDVPSASENGNSGRIKRAQREPAEPEPTPTNPASINVPAQVTSERRISGL